MIRKILLSTFLSIMFAFNICSAEEPLRFKENEDCHIIRLEQKGFGTHKFIHTGMNDNPFILEPIVFVKNYEALSLTDFKGKTNELIDITGRSFEIIEYYAWYKNKKINFWLVRGSRSPKYCGDLSQADGSGYLIERARNHYDIFIIAPTKECSYKVVFKLAPEDLDLAEPAPYPNTSSKPRRPSERTTSIQRHAKIYGNALIIKRAKYNFDLAKWDAWETVYGLEWDKANYELKIEKKEIRKCDP